MKNIYFVIIIMICTAGCYKSQDGPIVNLKLIGTWRLDSLYNVNTGIAQTTKMDTIFDASYYKGRNIGIDVRDGFKIFSSNYTAPLRGSYELTSSAGIGINIFELPDNTKPIYPKSDFKPLFISAMNGAETYRIDGDGGKGSRLFIYYDGGMAAAIFTKY